MLARMPSRTFWDERYSEPGLVYGSQANDFLVQVADRLPTGRALCLGEGEGRNAVFLAERGMEVVAVDLSKAGLDKAARLAAERGVALTTVVADLADFVIEPAGWDVITAIWCHLPQPLRGQVHRAVVAGLRPAGVFVLEAYTPSQLQRGTGGPRSLDLLSSLAELREELAGLELLHAVEREREVHEGAYHNGPSDVVQILARRPAAEG